jgi:hypothetical protein
MLCRVTKYPVSEMDRGWLCAKFDGGLRRLGGIKLLRKKRLLDILSGDVE